LEIPRGKILEAKYKAKLEFLGGRGVQNKTLPWGVCLSDISWNYTILGLSLTKPKIFLSLT